MEQKGGHEERGRRRVVHAQAAKVGDMREKGLGLEGAREEKVLGEEVVERGRGAGQERLEQTRAHKNQAQFTKNTISPHAQRPSHP
jgi:hypothetical protein